MAMGVPGCPELACWTASIARVRMVLMQTSSIDFVGINYITGLGHYAPPGHAVPTPHAYIYWHGGAFLQPVYAPASGVIEDVMDTPEGYKIWVRVNPRFLYILDHVTLFAPFQTRLARVTGGEQIGTTHPSAALDFGAYDSTHTRAFANPSRYSSLSLHAQSPWKYYPEDLRALLYLKSRVETPDKDGTNNYDLAGTLRGNWFLDGVPMAPEAEVEIANWGKQLSFGLDEYDSSKQVISVGGTITSPGVFWTGPFGNGQDGGGTYRWANITPGSGKVTIPAGPAHYFLVEMLDATTLKVEHFESPPADFTLAFQVYRR